MCEWPQMVHEQHSRMQFAALEIGRASKDGTLHEEEVCAQKKSFNFSIIYV